MLSHLSLFSGIGGIDLAAEWAGFTTVGQVEMADYPSKVLEKHWPNVPRWRDVRDVSAESFNSTTGLSSVTLVSAGYPCQTFSLAGKQEGDLTLAKEFVRVVGELHPLWALGENVGGHIYNGLDDVIRLLCEEGYSTRAFVLRAKDAGAPHLRRRVFVVAHSHGESSVQVNPAASTEREMWKARDNASWGYWAGIPEPVRAVSKPGVGRVAHGLPHRVDRLKGLGNAVVPQQVYPLLWAITQQLREERKANDARRGDTRKGI